MYCHNLTPNQHTPPNHTTPVNMIRSDGGEPMHMRPPPPKIIGPCGFKVDRVSIKLKISGLKH